jgi:hypothetical protein
LLVVIFLTWAMVRIVRSASREDDRLKLLLLSAVFLNLGAFVLSTAPTDIGSTRYLPTLGIFVPLLAGLSWYEAGISARLLRIATPLFAAAFLIPFAGQILSPTADPSQEVVEFLEANQLGEGYGSYWSASIFTLQSEGKVKVRQVARSPEGKLVPLEWLSARQSYEMRDARFLIFKDQLFGVNPTSAIKTWGPPDRQENVQGYTIFIWPGPLHLAEGALVPH